MEKDVLVNRVQGGTRAALALVILLITISLPTLAVIVNFPDPGLEAAIRDAIGKPTGDIHDTDLDGLTSLHADNRSISNLEGIQHCTNLTRLYLSYNQIADISVLSGLTNLTRLSLSDNQIADISPLSGLTNLTYLLLSNNQIADISVLSGLTNLTSLSLHTNQIADISVLSGLTKLTDLLLSYNQIADISPLSGLTKLTALWVHTNQIADISPLSGLTNLTDLLLSNNQIADISPLSGLTKLTTLWLFTNQIADISALSGLINLTNLILRDNQISDISALVANAGLGFGDTVSLQRNFLCLNPGSDDMIGIQELLARGVDLTYEPQYPPPELGVTVNTLPGGHGGEVSVFLDWWLEGELGISWATLDQYGFSLYRLDQTEPIYEILLSGLDWNGDQEDDLEVYRDRYSGGNSSYQGLYDRFSEYEDYGVNEGAEYSYFVTLWQGDVNNVVSSGEASIAAGAFAWGAIIRSDPQYGDPPLEDQYARLFELGDSGLGFGKFWVLVSAVELVGASWAPTEVINWEALPIQPSDPEALDELIEKYAFPKNFALVERFTDWTSVDGIIRTLNENGVSPFPWLAGWSTDKQHAANPWPAWIADIDSKTNEYLTRVYICARAAARRYRYGLRKVPVWNLENEVNWLAVHLMLGWRASEKWLEEEFVTKVLRAVTLAVQHENERETRDGSPIFYTRRSTNLNIHVEEANNPVGQAILALLNANYPAWLDENPWIRRSLADHISSPSAPYGQPWSSFFDIVGLGAYPNYLFGIPILDKLLADALDTAISASAGKPVMVLETGYPHGPDVEYLGVYGGWTVDSQSRYIERTTGYTFHHGGRGYIYYTLFSGEPIGESQDTYQNLEELIAATLTNVERYWGLVAKDGAFLTASDDPFTKYKTLIANDPSPFSLLEDPVVEVILVRLQAGESQATSGVEVFVPEDAALPAVGVFLTVSEGGSASSFGTSDVEVAAGTGTAPVKYADVKVWGQEVETGLFRVGMSIGLDELEEGQEASRLRLYYRPSGWVETGARVIEITGNVVKVFGDVLAEYLWGTPFCLGYDSTAAFRVDALGNTHSTGVFTAQSFVPGSADIAEWVAVSGSVGVGDVLSLDPSSPTSYRVSQAACSSLVAGVVSTTPGITLGGSGRDGEALLALIGIVPVKVTNEGGSIQPGDLLVTSSTPGHAMRWAGPGPCALVGKALEPMTNETGVILVLLTAH